MCAFMLHKIYALDCINWLWSCRILTKYMSHQIYGHKLSHLSFNRGEAEHRPILNSWSHLTESLRRCEEAVSRQCRCLQSTSDAVTGVVEHRCVLRQFPIKSLWKPLIHLLMQGMRTGACWEVTGCAGQCHWCKAGATRRGGLAAVQLFKERRPRRSSAATTCVVEHHRVLQLCRVQWWPIVLPWRRLQCQQSCVASATTSPMLQCHRLASLENRWCWSWCSIGVNSQRCSVALLLQSGDIVGLLLHRELQLMSRLGPVFSAMIRGPKARHNP